MKPLKNMAPRERFRGAMFSWWVIVLQRCLAHARDPGLGARFFAASRIGACVDAGIGSSRAPVCDQQPERDACSHCEKKSEHEEKIRAVKSARQRHPKLVPLRGFEPPDLLLTLQVLYQLSYNGMERIIGRVSSAGLALAQIMRKGIARRIAAAVRRPDQPLSLPLFSH